MSDDNMKTCTKCECIKPIDQFTKSRAQCKDCIQLKNKVYYETRKDNFKKYYKYEKTNKPRGRPPKDKTQIERT